MAAGRFDPHIDIVNVCCCRSVFIRIAKPATEHASLDIFYALHSFHPRWVSSCRSLRSAFYVYDFLRASQLAPMVRKLMSFTALRFMRLLFPSRSNRLAMLQALERMAGSPRCENRLVDEVGFVGLGAMRCGAVGCGAVGCGVVGWGRVEMGYGWGGFRVRMVWGFAGTNQSIECDVVFSFFEEHKTQLA